MIVPPWASSARRHRRGPTAVDTDILEVAVVAAVPRPNPAVDRRQRQGGRRGGAGGRTVLGWPKRCKLAHAFLWGYSDKRLKLAQLLGELGVFLTWYGARGARSPGSSPRHRRRCRRGPCSSCTAGSRTHLPPPPPSHGLGSHFLAGHYFSLGLIHVLICKV
jgi:hypothetical protein